VPGLAAALVDADGVRAIGAVGVRRADEAEPLQPDDVFHLGSDTKAMTAFSIARVVARGALTWDRTIGETFPDLDGIAAQYRGVTLEQLLLHRASLPENFTPAHLRAVDTDAAAHGFRRALVHTVLVEDPSSPPGSRFAYSNVGYIVAAAMLETVIDQTWETVMEREVFGPLSMTSCGFGPTASGTDRGRPWAHARDEEGGTFTPTAIDNPPFMAPAGGVHCSLQDWGKFAAAQWATGDDALLPEAELDRLHEGRPRAADEAQGSYAMGWIVASTTWTDGAVWTHDGSNTVNYASIVIVPDRRIAILAASNAAPPAGQQAVVQAVAGLLQQHGRAPTR
jgi:CubicO group peptidase (beta-lactamase class C family)